MMIKIVSMLVSLTICVSGFGQIKVELYGYSPCSKEIKQINFFGLRKAGVSFESRDTTGILLLKETGVYTLAYVLENIDTSQIGKEYHFESIGTFSDTLRLLSIEPCLEPTSHPNFIGYCCCSQKCEGTQVDYYENGNKRIEGNFKKGIPIGKLRFYAPDGKLSMTKKYNKRGKLVNIRRE